ncbi:MAG: hypothetical protein CMP23_00675 [Rickettsiales bacterium]|nr:hypothetical protein [Rickettsiales bacterium]
MSKTALVTGANGFIGSHLVDYLLERGDRVLAMVRKTSDLSNLEGREVEYRYAGLRDEEALVTAMEGVDIVYHVAGLTAAFNPTTLEEVNSAGTRRVLEAARQAQPGPGRVVYVSSLEAAGESHPNQARAEHHLPAPFTNYGRSKFGGELAAWRASRDEQGPEVVIVRPPLVYGPRDQDVLQMIQSANWRLIATPMGRNGWISAIHCHDLVRGIVLAGERGRPLPPGEDLNHILAGVGPRCDGESTAVPELGEGIYFFDDGGRHTIASFGHEAARILGKQAFTLPMPRLLIWLAAISAELVGRLKGKAPALNRDKVVASFATGWWCDSGKARKELGYSPDMSLNQGLQQTIRWLRDKSVL